MPVRSPHVAKLRATVSASALIEATALERDSLNNEGRGDGISSLGSASLLSSAAAAVATTKTATTTTTTTAKHGTSAAARSRRRPHSASASPAASSERFDRPELHGLSMTARTSEEQCRTGSAKPSEARSPSRRSLVDRIRATIQQSGQLGSAAAVDAAPGQGSDESATDNEQKTKCAWETEEWHRSCRSKSLFDIDGPTLVQQAPRVQGRVTRDEFERSVIRCAAYAIPDPGPRFSTKIIVVAADGTGSYRKITDALRDVQSQSSAAISKTPQRPTNGAGNAGAQLSMGAQRPTFHVVLVHPGEYREHVVLGSNTAIVAASSIHADGKARPLSGKVQESGDVVLLGPNSWEPVVRVCGTNCIVQGVVVRHMAKSERSSGCDQPSRWQPTTHAAAVVNQIGTKVLVYSTPPGENKTPVLSGASRSAMVTKINSDNTCNVSFDSGETQKYVPLSCLRADVDAQTRDSLRRHIESYRCARDASAQTASAWTVAENRLPDLHSCKLSMVPAFHVEAPFAPEGARTSNGIEGHAAKTSAVASKVTAGVVVRRCHLIGEVTGRCIQIRGASLALLAECLFEHGESHVTDGAAPHLVDCFLTNRWGSAVTVEGLCGPLLRGNTISGCHGTGIVVTNGGHPILECNFLSHCMGGGVRVDARSAGAIRSNTVVRNNGFGVCVAGRGAEPYLERNLISLNNGVGLLAMNSAQVRVAKNFFFGNNAAAVVHVTCGASIRMTGNVVLGTDLPDTRNLSDQPTVVTQVGVALSGDGGSVIRGNILCAFGLACLSIGAAQRSNVEFGVQQPSSISTLVEENFLANFPDAAVVCVAGLRERGLELIANQISHLTRCDKTPNDTVNNALPNCFALVRIFGEARQRSVLKRNIFIPFSDGGLLSYGVHVGHGAKVDISECTFDGEALSSSQFNAPLNQPCLDRESLICWVGIGGHECAAITVRHCIFHSVPVGIELQGPDDADVVGNLFRDNYEAGVIVCTNGPANDKRAGNPRHRNGTVVRCTNNEFQKSKGGTDIFILGSTHRQESVEKRGHSFSGGGTQNLHFELKMVVCGNVFNGVASTTRAHSAICVRSIRNYFDEKLQPSFTGSCVLVTHNRIFGQSVGVKIVDCFADQAGKRSTSPGLLYAVPRDLQSACQERGVGDLMQTGFVLSTNEIRGCERAGVLIERSVVTIAMNRVEANSVALVAGESSMLRLERNEFHRNKVCGVISLAGCQLDFVGDSICGNGTDNVIGQTFFQHEGIECCNGGIVLRGVGTRVTMQATVVADNAGFCGLASLEAASLELVGGCVVRKNAGHGVFVAGASVKVDHCSIVQNTQWGLLAASATCPQAGKTMKNGIEPSSDTTCCRKGCTTPRPRVAIFDSELAHCGMGGACLDANGQISRTKFHNNAGCGVYVFCCRCESQMSSKAVILGLTIEECSMTGNSGDGACFDGFSWPLLGDQFEPSAIFRRNVVDGNCTSDVDLRANFENLKDDCFDNQEQAFSLVTLLRKLHAGVRVCGPVSEISLSGGLTYMEELSAELIDGDCTRQNVASAMPTPRCAAPVLIEANNIQNNGVVNIFVSSASCPCINSNNVRGGSGFGIVILPVCCNATPMLTPTGAVSKNTVSSHKKANVLIITGEVPEDNPRLLLQLIDNRIENSEAQGLLVFAGPRRLGVAHRALIVARNTITLNSLTNVQVGGWSPPSTSGRPGSTEETAAEHDKQPTLVISANTISHSKRGGGIELLASLVEYTTPGNMHRLSICANIVESNSQTSFAMRFKDVDIGSGASNKGQSDATLKSCIPRAKVSVERNKFSLGQRNGVFVSGVCVRDHLPTLAPTFDHTVVVRFTLNIVEKHKLTGIEVADGACPLIDANAITANSGHGLNVYCGASGVYSNNVIQGNGRRQVQVSGSGSPVLSRNFVGTTTGPHTSSRPQLAAHDSEAVCLYGGTRAILRHNEFVGSIDNDVCVVAVREGSRPEIEMNAFWCCKAGAAVGVFGDSQCKIVGNKISGFGQHGILVNGSDCCLVGDANSFPGLGTAVIDTTAKDVGPLEDCGVPGLISRQHEGISAEPSAVACVLVLAASSVKLTNNRFVGTINPHCAGVLAESVKDLHILENRFTQFGAGDCVRLEIPCIVSSLPPASRQSSNDGGASMDSGSNSAPCVCIERNAIDGAAGNGIVVTHHRPQRGKVLPSSNAEQISSAEQAPVRIVANDISRCQGIGLFLEAVPFGPALLADNKLCECMGGGAVLKDSYQSTAISVRMENNHFRNNHKSGLSLVGLEHSGVTPGVHLDIESDAEPPVSLWTWWIVNNTFENEHGVAVRVDQGSMPRIAGNTITGSHQASIEVTSGARPSVSGNTIRGSLAEGVRVSGLSCRGVEICDNTITGSKSCGILVTDHSLAEVQRNTVKQNAKGGILFRNGASGVIAENTISRNILSGIEVCGTGTVPHVLRNRVFDGQQCGILVHDGATGKVHANHISNNRLAGISVQSGAAPEVTDNVVSAGQAGGIFVSEQGAGCFRNNDIFGNAKAGIAVCEHSNPTFSENNVHDNLQDGVYVYDEGRGVFDGNIIQCNALAGVDISDGADPVLRRNKIRNGGQGGVFIYAGAKGLLEDNDITGNAKANVEIKEASTDTILRNNRIHNGKQDGIYIYEGANALIEDNDVCGNKLAGIAIRSAATPTMQRNKIHGGSDVGILFYENARGTLTNCEVYDNEKTNVDVRTGSAVAVEDNHIHGSPMYGIRFSDQGTTGIVRGNDVHKNGKAGMLVLLGARPRVIENSFHNGESCGIVLLGDASGEYVRNNVEHNKRKQFVVHPDIVEAQSIDFSSNIIGNGEGITSSIVSLSNPNQTTRGNAGGAAKKATHGRSRRTGRRARK